MQLMLRGGLRRRLTSFATGAVERRLSSFTKTTAGAVELKISTSGLFSSDSTLLRARIFDTPTGQACPPSATLSPRTVDVPYALRFTLMANHAMRPSVPVPTHTQAPLPPVP